VVAPAAISSALTAFLASFAAAALPGPTLRMLFGTFLVAVGARQALVAKKPRPESLPES
jgi:uncharacterized membrane protein YfcA